VRLGAATRSRPGVGAIVVGVATVALAVLYEPVMRELVRLWLEAPEYSYGVLVTVLTACLLWARRRALRGTAAVWRPEGLAVMAAALALFAIGRSLDRLALQTLSLPLALAGLSLLALGRRRTRVLAFPLAFLALMTPLPAATLAAVSAVLQHTAARVAHFALRALGMPATIDGPGLRLGDTILPIADLSDGLRFLLLMLVAGVACAWTTQTRLSPRVLVVGAAGALAILANLARVTATAILAAVHGVDVALGFQLAYGKLAYALALVAFIALVLSLRRRARAHGGRLRTRVLGATGPSGGHAHSAAATVRRRRRAA